MRFSMQIHDVEVPVPGGHIDDAAVQQIDRRFEDVHEQLFGRGSGDRTGGIDFTAFQVRATARTGKSDLTTDGWSEPGRRSRSVYWSELRDFLDTPVYDEVPVAAIAGPALIELPDTVIVIRPGQRGAPDGAGNYVVDLTGQGR
jgi:N-methylhydantoinase A